MSKRLILAFIGLLLIFSFHLFSANSIDLQTSQEQACKLVDERKYAEASALIETLIAEKKGNSDLPEALYWVAERYRWAHKWQEAKDLYQYIKSNHPQSDFVSWANLGLARADVLSAIAARDLTKAEDELDKLIADFHDHPDTPETLYWLARGFGYAERHNTEKLIYETIVEDYPESPFVQKAKLGIERAKAQSLILSGKNEEAQQQVEKIKQDFSEHPDLQDALYWIGARYERMKSHEQAKNAYKEALQIAPNSMIDKAKIGFTKAKIKTLIKAQDFDKAKEAIDELIADFNGVAIPYKELEWIAQRYETLGEVEIAKGMFKQIISDCPSNERPFILSKAHLDKYQLFAAIDAGDKNKVRQMVSQMGSELVQSNLEPNLPVDKINGADTYLRTLGQDCYDRGWKLKTAGKINQAKEYFAVDLAIMERLFTEFPNSSLAPSAYFCAALEYGQEFDDYAKALEYFQKIVNNWPNYECADLSQLQIAEYLEKMAEAGMLPAEQTKPVIIEACQALIDNYPESQYIKHTERLMYKNRRHTDK